MRCYPDRRYFNESAFCKFPRLVFALVSSTVHLCKRTPESRSPVHEVLIPSDEPFWQLQPDTSTVPANSAADPIFSGHQQVDFDRLISMSE